MVKKRKKAKKKVSKVEEKVIKVEVVQPKVEDGEFKLKKETPVEESKPLPKEKKVKVVKNPNDPVDTHVNDGYKRPSITNVHHVHTKEQFRALMEAYKKQNPGKYKIKKSSGEFERKLKECI